MASRYRGLTPPRTALTSGPFCRRHERVASCIAPAHLPARSLAHSGARARTHTHTHTHVRTRTHRSFRLHEAEDRERLAWLLDHHSRPPAEPAPHQCTLEEAGAARDGRSHTSEAAEHARIGTDKLVTDIVEGKLRFVENEVTSVMAAGLLILGLSCPRTRTHARARACARASPAPLPLPHPLARTHARTHAHDCTRAHTCTPAPDKDDGRYRAAATCPQPHVLFCPAQEPSACNRRHKHLSMRRRDYSRDPSGISPCKCSAVHQQPSPALRLQHDH